MLKTHLVEPKTGADERVVCFQSNYDEAPPRQVEGVSEWLTLIEGELRGKNEMNIRDLVAFLQEEKKKAFFKNSNIRHIVESS